MGSTLSAEPPERIAASRDPAVPLAGGVDGVEMATGLTRAM
jgi:hypothetical protein